MNKNNEIINLSIINSESLSEKHSKIQQFKAEMKGK